MDTSGSQCSPAPAAHMRWVWWLPLLLVWLGEAFVTWRWAIDVPYWDSWEHTELVTGNAAPTPAVLWSQVNEHRVVVQKLYEVALARVTGWDQRLSAFVPLLLLFCSAVLFAGRTLKERPSLTPRQQVLVATLLGLLFLSARQTEMLVWGVLVSWAVLILVLVLFARIWGEFVESGRWRWAIPLAVIAAIGCTGQGLALCVFLVLAGAVTLVTGSGSRRVAAAAAAGIGGIALYYIGYRQPDEVPSPLTALGCPVALFKYAATYAGGPYTGLTMAPYVGALVLALGVVGWQAAGEGWDGHRLLPT